MHAVYVTQRHNFGAVVRQTVTDLPLLLLRAWPLCGASWDVLSRTCARGVSAVVKNRGRKDNKYSVERIHFTSTALHQHSPGGRGSKVGLYLFFPPHALRPFVPPVDPPPPPPPSPSPWCCPLWKLLDTGGEAGLEKKHLLIWLR